MLDSVPELGGCKAPDSESGSVGGKEEGRKTDGQTGSADEGQGGRKEVRDGSRMEERREPGGEGGQGSPGASPALHSLERSWDRRAHLGSWL